MERITIEINAKGQHCEYCQHLYIKDNGRIRCRIFPEKDVQYKMEAAQGEVPAYIKYIRYTRLKSCLDCSAPEEGYE